MPVTNTPGPDHLGGRCRVRSAVLRFLGSNAVVVLQLSAVTADGSASGQAAVDVLTNRPPLVGLLESSPGTGMAVVDRSKTPTISSMFPLERSKNSVCYTYLAAFMPPFF